jgi:glycosidase
MAEARLLYEVNTRVWLRELSERLGGGPIGLADVPDSELDRWAELGFTHIWLMGIWKIGPDARAKALEHWEEQWKNEIPSTAEDVSGSPYASLMPEVEPGILPTIAQVDDFRRRLLDKGLYLIIDFIPNHVGIDHPWLQQHPAIFVQSPSPKPGTFQKKTKFGKRYFAHGRDPYFPPWDDTVQLDYRNEQVARTMSGLAAKLSILCDGLRCDMAMLLMSEIFQKTWKDFPVQVQSPPREEFWWDTMLQITRAQAGAPDFLMIAESYWDTEEFLQKMGFDYTYVKPVYDFIVRRQYGEFQKYLRSKSSKFLRRGLYFLENHDEPRIASLLPLEEHKPAALLVLSMPGLRMIHDGQLEGRKAFARIQMSKRAEEKPDLEVSTFYQGLLKTLQQTLIGIGDFEFLQPEAVNGGTEVLDPVFIVKWSSDEGADLVLVNLGANAVTARLKRASILADSKEMQTRFSLREPKFGSAAINDEFWNVEFPAHSGAIVRFSK